MHMILHCFRVYASSCTFIGDNLYQTQMLRFLATGLLTVFLPEK